MASRDGEVAEGGQPPLILSRWRGSPPEKLFLNGKMVGWRCLPWGICAWCFDHTQPAEDPLPALCEACSAMERKVVVLEVDMATTAMHGFRCTNCSHVWRTYPEGYVMLMNTDGSVHVDCPRCRNRKVVSV